MRSRRRRGITLAELLIALAVLGVIATFTIPKVLQAQQDQRKNAIVKETVSAIAGAYQQYLHTKGSSATMAAQDLMPYFNALKRTSGSEYAGGLYADNSTGAASYNCQGSGPSACLLLANGTLLFFHPNSRFQAASNLNLLWVVIDMDPWTHAVDQTIFVALYYDGRVTLYSDRLPGSVIASPPSGTATPAWFHWD